MKINPIRPAIKPNIVQRMKTGMSYIGGVLYALNYVIRDSFTHKPYYVINKGKLIDERELPSAISRHDYWEGAKWGNAVYYPEDVEKMKSMNVDERLAYKRKLIEQEKYTVVWQD